MYISYCEKYLKALVKNILFLINEDELTESQMSELEVCFTIIQNALDKLNENR
jgi:hypothetical protein